MALIWSGSLNADFQAESVKEPQRINSRIGTEDNSRHNRMKEEA